MNAGQSIASRMNSGFQITFTSGVGGSLQLGGPVTTRDELDAVTEALAVMREWLPETDDLRAVHSEGASALAE